MVKQQDDGSPTVGDETRPFSGTDIIQDHKCASNEKRALKIKNIRVEESDKEEGCFRCLQAVGCVCLARLPPKWPGLFWFLIDVLLPLIVLVLV